MARIVLIFAFFASCQLMVLPKTATAREVYTQTVTVRATGPRTITITVRTTCTRTIEQQRKRSVGDGDDFMDRLINSTMEDMVVNWDANCDGYVDVIEWVQTANGSPEDFVTILNNYDSNGDSRFTYGEVLTVNMVINPNLDRFINMPMEMYEDMKEMADIGRGDSSKQRKTDE